MRPSSTFNDPKILNGPSKVFHSLVGPDLTIPAVSANYFNEAFGTFVPALVTDEARVFRSYAHPRNKNSFMVHSAPQLKFSNFDEHAGPVERTGGCPRPHPGQSPLCSGVRAVLVALGMLGFGCLP